MLFLLIIFGVIVVLVLNYERVNRLWRALKSDYRELKLYGSVIFYSIVKYSKSVCENFEKIVSDHPQKVLFYYEDEIWTSIKVKEQSDKVSLYFQKQGYKKGDVVALILDNCPEYVCIWYGLSQIGVVTALINTNLAKDPLIHSIKVTKCKAVICGSNHATSVADIIENFENIKVYQFTSKETESILTNYVDLRKQLSEVNHELFERTMKFSGRDHLFYIFTSGTTGLPKAAILTHTRFSLLSSGALLFPKNTVLYCPMPLYHGSGGILAIAQALIWGNTIAIRKKFSASNYWKDCVKYRCNAAQYIGEMCRYLLAVDPSTDIKHPVKMVFGNGLKAPIWKEFVNRFKIDQIFEFYGATEGNAALVNLDNKFGSVGRIPSILRPIYPLVLVKFNEDTGEPLRDERGRCIPINNPSDPGLLIVKINNRIALTQFKGYTNKEETNKKTLKDVFNTGDRYFNTGDAFEIDEDGYFYFLDRMGDTFRWKGENVSTSEIEGIISNLIQLKDAVVFGVQIEGAEGKAGMAVIASDNQDIDTDSLLKGFKENIPGYAIPIFIRVMDSLPLTSTFKLQKAQLRAEGYNINIIKDKVYFYDQSIGKYTILTPELYTNVLNKNVRL